MVRHSSHLCKLSAVLVQHSHKFCAAELPRTCYVFSETLSSIACWCVGAESYWLATHALDAQTQLPAVLIIMVYPNIPAFSAHSASWQIPAALKSS
jgi:hypothetical protein